jgi:hypothetical protein
MTGVRIPAGALKRTILVSEERRLLSEYDGISNTHRDAIVSAR